MAIFAGVMISGNTNLMQLSKEKLYNSFKFNVLIKFKEKIEGLQEIWKLSDCINNKIKKARKKNRGH